MTVAPSPYDLIRIVQDQQRALREQMGAAERTLAMLAGMLDASAPDPFMAADFSPPPLPTKPVGRRLGALTRGCKP